MATTTSARMRARIEATLASLAGGLGLLTLLWRDWLEVFGWDPDHGDGSMEWLVVLGLLAAAAVLGLSARRHRRLLGVATR